jgi:hypothetical protein
MNQLYGGEPPQSEFDAIPVGRLGAPRELGDIVCFLASKQASYINGAMIPVDGGLSKSLWKSPPSPPRALNKAVCVVFVIMLGARERPAWSVKQGELWPMRRSREVGNCSPIWGSGERRGKALS